MPTVDETVSRIVEADTWNQRIAQIRLVGQRHGTSEHPQIYAEVARQIYVPHLSPDFAYINNAPFYERAYFTQVYSVTASATQDFTQVGMPQLAQLLAEDPRTLLIFRTITGLTKEEFSHSTALIAEALNLAKMSPGKIDSMEKRGTPITARQAHVIAATITQVMDGSLFGDPPGGKLHRKQVKLDTARGWPSVSPFALNGVPYSDYLHQRHYGGSFRQVLDATSSLRGDIIEEAVEALFTENGVPFIRTGSHNQGDIEARFEILVTPAPDFVVFDSANRPQAILECKLAGDGGTARDKALRFDKLRLESVRLGGVPLIAVLGGMGWARVNDTLGPVVRDTDGRVFTLSTLPEMLTVAPFPTLVGAA